MKYMLMMHAPKEGWTNAGIGTWPKEAIHAHIAFMIGLNKRLKASGEFVDAQGLAGPEEAKVVRARKDGTPDTDGPFAEAKETIGGYFLLKVASLDEAVAIAKECPGLPHGIRVEVRAIAGECPAAVEARAETQQLANA